MRHRVASLLLCAVVVLVVVHGAMPQFPAWVTGVLAWMACLLLFDRIPPRGRLMTCLLVGVGAVGIAMGTASGRAGLVQVAFEQNVPLVGMIIAVSALRLIGVAPDATDAAAARGPKALARTMAGVHLFGAVINFSAVIIFADRITSRSKITIAQTMALTQPFMIGAMWSPFYAAMATALTVSPGASLGTLMAIGIPLTAVGLAITWFTLTSSRYDHARDFEGYPIRFETLWVPGMLAASVLLLHHLMPQWPILPIIVVLSPVVAFITLLGRDGSGAIDAFGRLIALRLPELGNEIGLFMGAGVLSAGMAGMIAALDLQVPFTQFGGIEASGVLVFVVVVAWMGFHPVILVSVIGPWVQTVAPDPNLLAMTFLMTWGMGLPACPMSNTLIAMTGRYGIPYREVLNRNRVYSIQLMLVGVAVLNLYAAIATPAR